MAKSIVDKLTDLQAAYERFEADRAASQKAAEQYQLRHDKAQAAFDAEEAAAKKLLNEATEKANASAAFLDSLQREVSDVLGTVANSRVTVSK